MGRQSKDRLFNELVKIRCQIKKNKNSRNTTDKPAQDDMFQEGAPLKDRLEDQSRDLFLKIFQGSPLLMSITSLDEGRYIDINNAFLTVCGYTREEVTGQTMSALGIFSTEDLRNFEVSLEQDVKRDLEMGLRTKEGEVRAIAVSVETINFNEQICLLSIMKDLTEIKLLQQEMARLGQLNLLGEMAASIGHEIRNPMTTARGFLQMLGGKKECSQYKEYFDLVIEELDRANTIVTEFLSMAQIKTKALKQQNLNCIIETLLPLIQADALIRDNIVTTELGEIPDLPLIDKEIRQLILNLTRNGLEAMEKGGTIRIQTYVEKTMVVMAICDQGKGIKEELVSKLGTPFLTSKENGTGLGLAVCYNIAARHNAEITAETGTSGTTFYVKFPTV